MGTIFSPTRVNPSISTHPNKALEPDPSISTHPEQAPITTSSSSLQSDPTNHQLGSGNPNIVLDREVTPGKAKELQVYLRKLKTLKEQENHTQLEQHQELELSPKLSPEICQGTLDSELNQLKILVISIYQLL